MTTRIIGIHGLANKSPEADLTKWWDDSIKEGLRISAGNADPQYEFHMVYWADLLYKYHQHQDPDFDFDDLHNEQVYVPAASGALRKYKERWLDDARAAVSSTGGAALDRVRDLEAGERDRLVEMLGNS